MNYPMWQIAIGLFMAWLIGYAVGYMLRAIGVMINAVISKESE